MQNKIYLSLMTTLAILALTLAVLRYQEWPTNCGLPVMFICSTVFMVGVYLYTRRSSIWSYLSLYASVSLLVLLAINLSSLYAAEVGPSRWSSNHDLALIVAIVASMFVPNSLERCHKRKELC